MTREELFNVAKEVYCDAIEIIKQTADKTKEQVPDFDAEIYVKRYDAALQSFLLKIALADGISDAYELQFIEKIVEYGDVLAGNDIKWQDLTQLNETGKIGFNKQAEKMLGNMSSFLVPLALLDILDDSRDLFEEAIYKPFSFIAASVSAIGESGITEEEQQIAQKMFDVYVAEPYSEIMKQILKKLKKYDD